MSYNPDLPAVPDFDIKWDKSISTGVIKTPKGWVDAREVLDLRDYTGEDEFYTAVKYALAPVYDI